jgi:uncharacterized protein YggE
MNRITKILACALAFASVGLVAATQQDQGMARDGERGRFRGAPATLTVRGEALLDKPADQLQIALSVVTEGKEAAQVLEENSRQTQAVIDAMLRAGLDKKEYQTGGLNVHPLYSQRPRAAAGEEWSPEIVGFRASHRLNIKTTKLELIGSIIGAASEAGANTIDSISFGLADPRTHRQESIKAATENAVADAKTLAEAAGIRLVRILSINLDHAHAQPFQRDMMMGRQMMAMEAGAGGPPVQGGDVNVQASVTVVYEIEDAD